MKMAPSFKIKRILEKTIIIGSILGFVFLVYTQFTILVFNPEGLKGNTSEALLISRIENLNFIDSQDSICQRNSEEKKCEDDLNSLLKDETKVFAKLPYVEWLKTLSTNNTDRKR